MRRTTIFALSLIASVPVIAGETDPTAIAEAFCAGSLASDMSAAEALLMPDLAAAVAEAKLRNDEIQAAAPDEKPPLGDGLPWRSYPDYADGCTVGAISHASGKTQIDIRYSFTQWPDADYTDTLVLAPDPADPQQFRIDDVLMIEGQTFRTALVAMFEDWN